MKSLLRISKTWERIENNTGGAATVAMTTKEKDEEEFAQYLIINSITSPQRANVRGKETAREMWEGLRKIHLRTSSSHKLFMKRELWNMRLALSEDASEFIRKFKAKLNDLEAVGEAIDDKEKGFLLLNTLPDSFNTLVMAFDALEQAPGIENIEPMILNEYARKKSEPKPVSTAQAFTTKREERKRHMCPNCEKPVFHKPEDCSSGKSPPQIYGRS